MLDLAGTTLLNRVREARSGGRPATGAGSATDLATAYRVQSELGAGRSPSGYRLLATGVDDPPYVFGRLYLDMAGDEAVSIRGRVQPRLRPLLATLLARPLPEDATPGAALLAIAGHVLALEVVDSVWPDGSATLAEVVAENAATVGYLVDERLLARRATGRVTVHLGHDSVTTYADPAADGIAEQLCWLASRAGGLAANQLVFAAGHPSDPAIAARPGMVRLQGPHGSALLGVVTA